MMTTIYLQKLSDLQQISEGGRLLDPGLFAKPMLIQVKQVTFEWIFLKVIMFKRAVGIAQFRALA
jgi:hypothetical protein